MKKRSAIKTDLFAALEHRAKIDRLGDPLAEIATRIDFTALAAEVDRIAPRPVSAQGGRPPFPSETMVRILVLKRLYNLSDEQMEFQLLDRMSYQRFCGLTDVLNIPDRTTIWSFENRIGEAGARALFDGVTAQLLRLGFIARGGQIIAATLVPAPRQKIGREERAIVAEGAMPAKWRPAQRRQKDIDATWTKKHGKSHFGYKLSVSVDRRYKLIRTLATDTASVHDSQHFEAVLDRSNTSRDVYADRGYPSQAREASLKERGWRARIQRKGSATKPLSDCQKRRNRKIATTRARVEHVFAAIEQMGGKFIRTIGQARANFAMTMMAATYNILRWCGCSARESRRFEALPVRQAARGDRIPVQSATAAPVSSTDELTMSEQVRFIDDLSLLIAGISRCPIDPSSQFLPGSEPVMLADRYVPLPWEMGHRAFRIFGIPRSTFLQR